MAVFSPCSCTEMQKKKKKDTVTVQITWRTFSFRDQVRFLDVTLCLWN